MALEHQQPEGGLRGGRLEDAPHGLVHAGGADALFMMKSERKESKAVVATKKDLAKQATIRVLEMKWWIKHPESKTDGASLKERLLASSDQQGVDRGVFVGAGPGEGHPLRRHELHAGRGHDGDCMGRVDDATSRRWQG